MSAAAKKKPGNKGLGRGLDALLGSRAGGETPAPDEQRRDAPIEFLTPARAQPRTQFDEAAIEELAESIRARGVLQPVLVRPISSNEGGVRYEIVAGERRWRAAQRAKLHRVPIIIRELTDDEAGEVALIENVQRVDLNPIEEANAYRRLVKSHGRKQDEIAKAIGKSRSHVANMMRLLKLPERARDALSAGALTMGHARALLASDDPAALCEHVLSQELSVRETERLAQSRAKPRSEKKQAKTISSRDHKDGDTRALERDLSAALGLDVEIDHTPKGGSITVRYLDLDQLDDICRRLMASGV